MSTYDEIETRFTYYAPKEVWAAVKDLAHLICDHYPDSRERSLALTKLEEAVNIYESVPLPGEDGVREFLGAINYIAAEIILRSRVGNPAPANF